MRFFNITRLTSLQRVRLFLLTLLVPGQLFLPCNAQSSGLLIVYPKVKAPYDKIYEDIIKGINDNYPGISQELELPGNGKNSVLAEQIKQHQPDVLVALGKRSLKKVRQLASPIPIVAGAITKTEDGVAGVSMSPDSEVILSHLLGIAPFVKRVYVVSDLQHLAQLEGAEAYLSERGKVLQIEEVESVQQAADKYLKIIHRASTEDAIWLMRGASLNDPSILMLVLEAAWKKKIVVFSSNPSHVKRGALFSLYPDNVKMGRALATIAQQHELDLIPADTSLTPLRSVHLIVNKRTSKHLGIMPNNISGLTIHRLL
jgi:putative ABC transport system substrate-binding protein